MSDPRMAPRSGWDTGGHPPEAMLSALIDGDVSEPERERLEAHLATCATCSDVLEALRTVVARAAALPAGTPPNDLWPGIAAHIRTVHPLPRRRVWELTLPQLTAAGFLVAALSAGAMWLAISKHPIPPAPGVTASSPSAAVIRGSGAVPAAFDVRGYDAAIAELEGVLHEHRAELDTSTVRVIEQNLKIIDHATAEARAALAADPANPYLNDHLAEQLQRKVDLLRQATAVVAAHG